MRHASSHGPAEMSNPSPQRARQGADYVETPDVQKLHAAIQREKREPRAGLEPLSLWLLGVYALTIFFGGFYLARYSGEFPAGGLDPTMAAQSGRKTATAGE